MLLAWIDGLRVVIVFVGGGVVVSGVAAVAVDVRVVVVGVVVGVTGVGAIVDAGLMGGWIASLVGGWMKVDLSSG